jgi:hypothetical protein
MSETRTYFAISLFSSRTFWVAALTLLIGLVAEPEIVALIPLSALPRVLVGVGLVNMVLRKLTVRPVVISVPGTTQPVEVPKIGPPAPPVVSD